MYSTQLPFKSRARRIQRYHFFGRCCCFGWSRDACFGAPVGARFDDSGLGQPVGGFAFVIARFAAASHW